MSVNSREILIAIYIAISQKDATDYVYEFINIEMDLKQKLTTDYIVFFEKLGHLNIHINNFFEEVMINVEDQVIKNNRLSLLHMINYYYK